jgi:hypothetical protein
MLHASPSFLCSATPSPPRPNIMIANGRSKISAEELAAVLCAPPRPGEVRRMIEEMDADRDGFVGRMPERSTSAADLFDETPQRRGKGAGRGESPDGSRKRVEKSRSVIVVAQGHAGRHVEVVQLFCRMQTEGVPVCRFVLPSVFRACASICDSRMHRFVHGLVIKCGLCQHVVVGAALVDGYVDFGLLYRVNKIGGFCQKLQKFGEIGLN